MKKLSTKRYILDINEPTPFIGGEEKYTSLIINDHLAKDFNIKALQGSFVKIIFKSAKQISDGKFKISFALKYKKEEKFKTINRVFEKENLSASETFFVGLAYLYSEQKDEVFWQQFFRKNVLLEMGSCLPTYALLQKNSCDEYCRAALSSAINFDDTFPGFYELLCRKDKNLIRRKYIAKIGYKKFPYSTKLALTYARSLFEDEEYEKCVEVHNKILSTKKLSDLNWSDCVAIMHELMSCYIALGKTDDAERVLKNEAVLKSGILSNGDLSFISGVFCYSQKADHAAAVSYFKNVICEEMHDSDTSIASMFLLIGSYLKQKDFTNVSKIAKMLMSSDFTLIGELGPLPHILDTYEEIIKILESFHDTDLPAKDSAILKGYLGLFYIETPPFITQKMSRKDKKILVSDAVSLLKSSLEEFPNHHLFKVGYSNALYKNEQFEDAIIASMRCFEKSDDIGYMNICEADIAKCSDDFLDGYADALKKNIGNNMHAYATSNFIYETNHLFSKRKYEVISELYELVKEYMPEIVKDADIYSFMDNNGGLFNVAFSLAESDRTQDAISIYLMEIKQNEKSYSSMNNVALLFEQISDQQNAEKYIRKAFEVTGKSDELVLRNFKRITSESNASTENGPEEAMPNQEERPECAFYFNKKNSCIEISKYRINVSPSTRLYALVEALFSVDDINEDIFFSEIAERIDIAQPPTDKDIYNWIDRLRTKIAAETGIRNIFRTTTHSLRINSKYLRES